jgi:hypothetical protein
MRLAALTLVVFVLGPLTAVQADEQQTPGAKIQVNACSAVEGRAAYNDTYTDSDGKVRTKHVPEEDSYLKIHFRNTAGVVAEEVDFGLVARNDLVEKIKDVGTFSPGVLIQHKYKVSRSIFPLRTALPYCAVLRVRYADGHVWTNPEPPKA